VVLIRHGRSAAEARTARRPWPWPEYGAAGEGDDAGWEVWLTKLAAYKAAHGHCNVPRGWAEDPKLAKWVNSQRTLKKKLDRGEPCEGMTAARAARLEALGFDWEKQPRQPARGGHKQGNGWAAQLDKLAAYSQEHGDCNVPYDWAEDPALGQWVSRQRTLKKKLDRGEPCEGMYNPAARVAELEALGFDWERSRKCHDAGWEILLTKLVAYKAAHGHCNVPFPWPEDPALGNWVNKQRRGKKKLDLTGWTKRSWPCEGMTAARAARLDAVGFEWHKQPRQPSRGGHKQGNGWAAQLDKLAAYSREHGDCNVPHDWSEDPKLGQWVSRQWNLKKKLDRGEPCEGMSAAQVAELEALGFDWETRKWSDDAGWEIWLAKLVAYKAAHGHCNVPGRWPEDPALGQWVRRQRWGKKKLDRGEPCEGMSAARAARLTAVGFAWERPWNYSSGAGWEAQLARLVVYKAEHGDCSVTRGPRTCGPAAEDARLASWVYNQRVKKRKLDRGEPCKGMTVAWAARLTALGFVWDQREAEREAELVRLVAYKAEHGDCNVPCDWAGDPRLASWVDTQRRFKRQLDSSEASPRVKVEWAQLTALGFAWDSGLGPTAGIPP
jgi:hypothetical protein